MGARFSDRYAIDPQLRTWGGEEYGVLYPMELLKPVFDELGLDESVHEQARLRVLSAAGQYESHKTTVLERQSTPTQEKKQRIALAKKATAFLKAYVELDEFRLMGMHAAAHKVCPQLPPTFIAPDIRPIAELATIATLASSLKEPVVPHFAPSHTHYVWVMNIARIFENSNVEVSVGSFYDTGISQSLDLLHTLMKPLDPVVTKEQLAEAVKAWVKTTGRSKVRKKTSKDVQINP